MLRHAREEGDLLEKEDASESEMIGKEKQTSHLEHRVASTKHARQVNELASEDSIHSNQRSIFIDSDADCIKLEISTYQPRGILAFKATLKHDEMDCIVCGP